MMKILTPVLSVLFLLTSLSCSNGTSAAGGDTAGEIIYLE